MNTIKKLLLTFTLLTWLSSGFAATTTHHKNTKHKKLSHSHSTTHKKKSHHAAASHKKPQGVQFSHLNVYPGLEEGEDETPTIQPVQFQLNPMQPSMIQTTSGFTIANMSPPSSFTSSFTQRLSGYIQQSVSGLRYTAYKLGGTHFDTSRGIYIVDCSGYVDNTLRAVYPKAYLSLVDSSGTSKPNTSHYYDFFKGLSTDPDHYWSKVEDVEGLRPGDILVFRYRGSHRHSHSGGHVMVVMNQPVRQGNMYLVSVADSASSGHSQDTRTGVHSSGVGIGTLLLRINPKTGQPAAYAWKIGAQWRSNVNFAMARPMDGKDS